MLNVPIGVLISNNKSNKYARNSWYIVFTWLGGGDTGARVTYSANSAARVSDGVLEAVR